MAILDPFSSVLPAWIDSPDMENDADSITLVSGVRFRRNIAGFAFPGKCEKSELYDLAALALGSIGHSEGWEFCDFRMIDSLDGASRNVLLESRLITPLLAQGGPGRFLMRDETGSVSCMINEEDHVSMIVTRPGLDVSAALAKAESLEGALDMHFMRDSVLGYLTANPGYVGTGVTASVLLHLPALDVLDEMPKVCDAFARDWKKLALYRLLSDKNNECGSFFMLSNRVTLATATADIAAGVADAAQSLASKELSARHKIRSSRDGEMDDRLWRAWGVLRHARKLSFNEAINMFSLVKLGSDMGILPHIYNREWKRMVMGTQRYHLALSGQGIIREQSEEVRMRAARFRQFMEKKSASSTFEMPERDKEL
jgi:protein arginine kinase